MKDKTHPKSAYLWAVIVLFAVLAAYLTMRSCSLYGPGLSPDSTGYIRLARDISQNGFAFLSEKKAVIQPPAYPMALAMVSKLVGITVLTAATWINIVTSAALVASILLIILRVTSSIAILTAAGILSSFSVPLTLVWSMAWTEPMFILAVTLVLLLVGQNKNPALSAILSGFLTAVACLTRYAGIVLIPIVIAFIFLSQNNNVWKRYKYIVLYTVTPTILFALYVLRNYAISRTPFGGRSPSQIGLVGNIDRSVDIFLAWFLPSRISSFQPLLLVAFVFAGAFAWYNRHHIVRGICTSARIFSLHAAFFVVYLSFTILTSTTTAYDHINSRLLSPIFPSLIVLIAILFKPEFWHGRAARLAAWAVFCLLLLVAPLRVAYHVNRNAEQGAGGYNSRQWQESEIIAHFRQNGQPKNEIIFSNGPDALYILAGIVAEMSPAARHYHSDRTTGVTQDNLFAKYPSLDGALLVWFDQKHRDYLYTPSELKGMCHLVAIKEFSDGTIYKIQSSNKHIESDK